MADLPPGLLPVHITRAHQNALAIRALGVGDMQVRRVGQQQGQGLLKVQSKMGAGHLQVGQVQAQAQLQSLRLGREFIGHHEDVLMALAAKVPGEGGHVLGNQFGAAEVDLLAGGLEPVVEAWPPVEGEGLIGREAADVGNDQHGIGLWEIGADQGRGVHDPLEIVDGSSPIGRVLGGKVEEFTVLEEFGGMDHQSGAGGLLQIGPGVLAEIAIGQMKLV